MKVGFVGMDRVFPEMTCAKVSLTGLRKMADELTGGRCAPVFLSFLHFSPRHFSQNIADTNGMLQSRHPEVVSR